MSPIKYYSLLFLAVMAFSCEKRSPSPQALHGEPIDRNAGIPLTNEDSLLVFMEDAFGRNDTSSLTGLPFSSVFRTKDLDLDGTPERITIYFYNPYLEAARKYSLWTRFTLIVDSTVIHGEGSSLVADCHLVDIDTSDSLLEIAIPDDGESDDYCTLFFSYRKGTLRNIGSIEGHNQYSTQVTYPGNGEIHTRKRSNILQTWWYRGIYRLNANHDISFVNQPLYKTDYKVTVISALKLLKSPTDHSTAFVLKPGEKVMIEATDDKRWCVVRRDNGQRGWFSVINYSSIEGTGRAAADFFEGLSYAD